MSCAIAELRPHPASPGGPVRRIAATIGPGEFAELAISFHIEGDMSRLRIPCEGPALRTDRLWQHSCFEVFLAPDVGDGYYEFNFSASGAWAGYRFSGRRAGRASPEMPAPQFRFRHGPEDCELSAVIPLAALLEFAPASKLRAGLAAVMEDRDGRLSYWALAHRSAQPDFHDPPTFALSVARR